MKNGSVDSLKVFAKVQGPTWPLRNRLLEATRDRLIDAQDRGLLAVGYDTLLQRAELVSVNELPGTDRRRPIG